MSIVGRIALFLVAAAFAWAGVAKAWDPVATARSIDGFRLLPWPLVVACALWLPWLELVTALALVTVRWRRAGGILALGLLTIFIAALVAAGLRGIDLACGCFGPLEPAGLAWPITRDVLLVGLLIGGLRWTRVASAPQPQP